MTIETMGYFLSAIKSNQELFNNEYPVIMTTMIKLFNSLSLDDPQQESILVIFESMASILGG